MTRLPTDILIATRNSGKIKEIQDLVRGLPIRFLSMDDLPGLPDIVEDRATFEENALKKAREIALASGMMTLADDSGLCIDALGGRPGVYSARYGREGASDPEKCTLILQEMLHVPEPQRTARFVCVLALVGPKGAERLFRGVCEGRITLEAAGSRGFGYDPIFFSPETGCTFAQTERQSKNRVSHRGRALRALAEFLRGLDLRDELR